MPVLTDLLLMDTQHLSAEEFGAYCLIMFATWRNHGRALKDDDVAMARIARVRCNRWSTKLKRTLTQFFDISDGYWHQRRLETEWDRIQNTRTNQSRAGTRSAELRALKKQETGSTVVDLPLQRSVNGASTKLQPARPPAPADIVYNTTVLTHDSSLRSESCGAAAPPDPIKELFDTAVRILVGRGIAERQARSLLGRWRKDLKDDGKLLSLLLLVEREAPVDVIGYMTKAVERAGVKIQPFSAPGFA